MSFCFPLPPAYSPCCPDEQVLWHSWDSVMSPVCRHVALSARRTGANNFTHTDLISKRRHRTFHGLWRTYSTTIGMEEQSSSGSQDYKEDEFDSGGSAELQSRPLSSEELKMLLLDSERTKLVKKLSEANQLNRFLKRQLQGKEDVLINFKSELAVVELEVQALVTLAEEITKAGIPEGSRKIKGKYIHSHLLSRLEAVQKKLREQIKDVDVAQSKSVLVYWIGMAESVQVMGTFDGWSQGEHLSPEYTGSYTKFSMTLSLRPGRYEIKFLVDGEWRLSPELPTIGDGLMSMQ